MNTIVQRLDGTIYDLEQIGITTRDFNPLSSSYRHNGISGVRQYGDIDAGTTQGARIIKCKFYLKAYDKISYVMHRDEVFRIFRSEEAFYIIDTRHPGKRWLVKCNSEFEIDQKRIYGFFDIDFITFSPLAESVISTSELFTFESNKLQIGMNLPTDKDVIYTHITDTFEIYNAGDVTVDPREFPLLITFKGASTNLKIKNVTTNEEWAYTGTTVAGDIISLNRVRALKNEVSIFGNTNRKRISIAPGWNDFIISGTEGTFEISFDFRFRYL